MEKENRYAERRLMTRFCPSDRLPDDISNTHISVSHDTMRAVKRSGRGTDGMFIIKELTYADGQLRLKCSFN